MTVLDPVAASRDAAAPRRVAAVVGFLVYIEIVSGVLQGSLPPLLPALGAMHHVSAGDLNWVASVQLMAAAAAVPLFGRLGDLYGHRRLLRISVLMLTAGSLLVATASSFEALLVGRFMQAPLAALLPLEIGIVRDRLDPQRARKAIGLLIGSLVAGGAVGAVGIGWVFRQLGDPNQALLVPAAMTVLAVPVTYFLIPETVTRKTGVRVDWLGALLLSTGLGTLLFGLAKAKTWGWGGAVFALVAVGLLVLAVWVWIESRVQDPMVDVRALAHRSTLPLYGASLLLGIAFFGSLAATAAFQGSPPDQLGYGLGLDALQIGLLMLPMSLMAFVGATFTPRVGGIVGYRAVLVSGLALFGLGYLLTVTWHTEVWHFVVANVLIGLGSGIALGALPTMIVELSPADRTGINAGIYNTFKTAGGSIAGGAFAALFAAMSLSGSQIPAEGAYVSVWAICAASCILAALLVFIARKPAGS